MFIYGNYANFKSLQDVVVNNGSEYPLFINQLSLADDVTPSGGHIGTTAIYKYCFVKLRFV